MNSSSAGKSVTIAKPGFGPIASALFLLAWILVASTIAVLLGGLNWVNYYRLARSGVAIEGYVTRKEPTNHLAVYYSYFVGSKTYSGVGNASSPEDLREMRIGDTIWIHYLAEDPRVSCWSDPKRLLVSETLPIVLAVLIIPAVLLCLVYRAFRRWLCMDNRVSSILVLLVCPILLSCAVDARRQAAEVAINSFHTRLDSEEYSEIYATADEQLRRAAGESEITSFLAKVHRSLGKLRSTKLRQSKVGYLQGLGTQVILSYDSEFENGFGLEQFLWQIRDGKAYLVHYDIKSAALPD